MIRPFGTALRLFITCLGIGCVALSLTSCITPSEKRGMKDDIFTTQTRLLNLERLLADTSKDAKNSGDSATKRIASTQTEIERLGHELQVVHGDIDTLRVGILTGQMPGVDPATQEHSVANTLAKLSERMDALESAQEDLIEALKKAGVKSAKKKETRKPIGDVAELQQAFDAKKYKQVVEDAAKLGKSGNAEEAELARYLLAESQFRLGNIREAALKFNDFVDSKPTPKYLPQVKLRLGDCFRHLGDAMTAKVFYEELIKEFPSSDEANKAKERLADTGSDKSKG